MRLVTNYLESSFEIKNHKINTIVLEDPKHFTDFLKGLIGTFNKENTDFIIYEDNEEKALGKCSDIIFDLFNLELNNSRVLKKLFTELENDLNSEDMYVKKIELESHILKVIDEILFRSRFSLKSNEVDYDQLFKCLGVSFDYDHDSILESLIEFMRLSYALLGTKLFIIINLDSFFEDSELLELSKFLSYNDIRVLALQNNIKREIGPFDNLRIVDKDLCEI